MRKNKGFLFLLIGCILLFAAGGWYVYNRAEDQNAGRQAAELLEKLNALQETTAPSNDLSVTVVEGDAFCGRITIEKLGIELPVFDEWNDTYSKTAPCRYSGSTETTDMIIAAHNYKSHFGDLHRLQLGDEVRFTDVRGRVYIYQVCELAILDGTAVSDMQAGDWDFTLFTCAKGGQQRVTVRCKQK